VEFSGDIGLIIGGGGASLTIFDAVIRYGGSPANYCEVGGNPTVKKVTEITKLILSRKVKGLLVITNVLNNTRVDLIARGVIKGILECGMDPKKVIGIFRVPGAWEEEGKKILAKYGIPFAGREVSLDEAVKKGLERLRGE
jgi:succinyl-CoA synthetase beta subunit/citryl-CoA synthetase large subunit